MALVTKEICLLRLSDQLELEKTYEIPETNQVKPGPTTGVAYKDADEIRAILIASTYELINSGHPVQSLTARLVTQTAELDKMYVNRFFKNLDELLYAVLEDIFTNRTPTFVISKDFSLENLDPLLVNAFKIYGYLAGVPVFEEKLRVVAEVLLHLFSQQLQDTFGLEKSLAVRESRVGLMLMVGFLSVGHLMPLLPEGVSRWAESREAFLRGLSTNPPSQ
jgi:AcrR family transcriptional regulator